MKPSANKKQDCCGQPSTKKDKALVCPMNGQQGQRVSSDTLRHLLKKERVHEINHPAYYFCKTADCDTVYYHPKSGQCFQKADLRVRVGLKETTDPLWLCYCFDISKKMIDKEITARGRSSFSDDIRKEVAAGHCKCKILNPSGRCCLGEVLAAEKEAQSHFEGRPLD